MKPTLSDHELLERYVSGAWALKIRLQSARRQLWDRHASLIHLENSALQVRKCCELVAKLCIIAADFHDQKCSQKLMKSHRVGEVFKSLQRQDRFHLPQSINFKKIDAGPPARWHIEIAEVDNADAGRLSAIHSQTGNLLHELSLYERFVKAHEGPEIIFSTRNAIRADHQWIWNKFWQHMIWMRGEFFCVQLGEVFDSTRPTVMKNDGFTEKELNPDFDPDFLSDFYGKIDWSKYGDDSPSVIP